MTNRLSELITASSSESSEVATAAIAALDLEKKLSEQLAAFKADMVSNQSLQNQISELRESNAASDERCGANDQHISELNAQLNSLREAEKVLIENLTHAELQIIERAGPSSEEYDNLKQELEDAKRQLDSADETETQLKTVVQALKESMKSKEDEVASVTRQKTDCERKVSVDEEWHRCSYLLWFFFD
jgi:chromosome segregation ATPase